MKIYLYKKDNFTNKTIIVSRGMILYLFSYSCIIHRLIYAQTGSFEYKSAACLSVIFELLPGLILLASLRNAE